MKSIGNIYVTWRKGKGARRVSIGIIRNNCNEGIRFEYIEKGVKEAKEFGFTPYEGFPDVDKIYTNNVISIFGQRLVNQERNDVNDFYDFWKIKPEFKKSEIHMLAYTQGLLPTDNFEFLAVFNSVKDLSFVSEIAGLSQTKILPTAIQIGDKLRYEKEFHNSHDNSAVKIFKDDLFLGYVKMIHSKVLFNSKNHFNVHVQHIEKNGFLNRVFIHICK